MKKPTIKFVRAEFENERIVMLNVYKNIASNPLFTPYRFSANLSTYNEKIKERMMNGSLARQVISDVG